MLRFVLESLLGIRARERRSRSHRCSPKGWTRFRVHYRFEETLTTSRSRIAAAAKRRASPSTALLQRTPVLELSSDGAEHNVTVECGPAVV
jgi:hypothetical protein